MGVFKRFVFGVGVAAVAAVLVAPAAHAATTPPILTSPESLHSYSQLPITYTLPENASPGSVRLVLDSDNNSNDRLVTLTRTAAGTYSFTLDPANPTANFTEVATITPNAPIADDTYKIALSYQNTVPDPAASSLTASAVSIDSVAQSPVLTSPTSNQTATGPFAIGYTLPEAPLPGSTKIIFHPVNGGTDLSLTLGNAAAGSASWSFDPSAPLSNGNVTATSFSGAIPNGTYTVRIDYADLAGNAAASAKATNFVIAVEPAKPPETGGGSTGSTSGGSSSGTSSGGGTTSSSGVGSTPDASTVKPKTLKPTWSFKRKGQKTSVKATFTPVANTRRSDISATKGSKVRKATCRTSRRKGKLQTRCSLALTRGSWVLTIESTDAKRVVIGTATKRARIR